MKVCCLFCSLLLANDSKLTFQNLLSANFKAIAFVFVFGKTLETIKVQIFGPATRDMRQLDYLPSDTPDVVTFLSKLCVASLEVPLKLEVPSNKDLTTLLL